MDRAWDILPGKDIGELFDVDRTFDLEGLNFFKALGERRADLNNGISQLTGVAKKLIDATPISDPKLDSIRTFLSVTSGGGLDTLNVEQLSGLGTMREIGEALPEHIERLEAASAYVDSTAAKCADAFARLADETKAEAGKPLNAAQERAKQLQMEVGAALDTLRVQAQKIENEIERARLLEGVTNMVAPYIQDFARLAQLNDRWKGLSLRDKLDLQFDIRLFEITTPLEVDLNALTMANLATLQLPDGVELKSRDLQNALKKGEFKLPDLDVWKCLAFAGVGFKVESGRENLVRKYSSANLTVAEPAAAAPAPTPVPAAPPAATPVPAPAPAPASHGITENSVTYISSERWLKWASPDSVINAGVKIYASGGEGAKTTARDALDHLNYEMLDLLAWAKIQAVPISLGVAEHAYSTVKNLKMDDLACWTVKTGKVGFNFEEVPYKVTAGVSPPGFEKWNKLLAETAISGAIDSLGSLQWQFTKPHLGFALTVEDLPQRPIPEKMLELFVDQRGSKMMEHLTGLLPNGLKTENKGGDSLTILSDNTVIEALGLGGLLKMSKDQLLTEWKKGPPGSYVIDLKKSDLARDIEAHAEKMTFFPRGNGKATVEKFDLDLKSGRVELKIALQHQYVWNGVRQAYKDIRAAVKSGNGVLKSDAFKRFLENAVEELGEKNPQTQQLKIALELLEKANIEQKLEGVGEQVSQRLRRLK